MTVLSILFSVTIIFSQPWVIYCWANKLSNRGISNLSLLGGEAYAGESCCKVHLIFFKQRPQKIIIWCHQLVASFSKLPAFTVSSWQSDEWKWLFSKKKNLCTFVVLLICTALLQNLLICIALLQDLLGSPTQQTYSSALIKVQPDTGEAKEAAAVGTNTRRRNYECNCLSLRNPTFVLDNIVYKTHFSQLLLLFIYEFY